MIDWRIKKIFNHYGKEGQLGKTIEEAVELQEAARNLLWLLKAYQGDDRTSRIEKAHQHLAEEIEDVRIMCDQLEYGLTLSAECEYQRYFKLGRQLSRMEKENELAKIGKCESPA